MSHPLIFVIMTYFNRYLESSDEHVVYLSLRKFAQSPFQNVPLSGFREGGRGMGKNLSERYVTDEPIGASSGKSFGGTLITEIPKDPD
jgi:hypothetical protein